MGTVAAGRGADGGIAGPGILNWDIMFQPAQGFEHEIFAITVCNIHATLAKTFDVAISVDGIASTATPFYIVKNFSLGAEDSIIIGGEGLLAHIGQGDALLLDGQDGNIYFTVAGRKQKIRT